MPCYTASVVSVILKAENLDILQKAAKSLGLTVTSARGSKYMQVQTPDGAFTIADGKATGTQTVVDKWVNPLRVAYTLTMVRHASNQMGWSVSQTNDTTLFVRKA